MTNQCPACNRALPENAPAGICPHCLLQTGLVNETSDSTSPTELQRFQPLSVETLSPFFEQLDIRELLGQGGMGTVYKAKQLKLDRWTALKILRPESAEDEAFAERFNREARTMARLDHPQIVGIHDFGEIDIPSESDTPNASRKLYYFLMEYVEGENLRETLRRDRIDPEQALSIVTQVCEALQFAHEEGVIHRDIKPENILIDLRGKVKIADFGLAKLATPSDHDFTLTGTHQVMGTPRYMAPEQMAGSREVDHRADIYSLGAVFYEMLTGEIPAGHFSPPSHICESDPRLDDVVYRMLANKPEERFSNAQEVKTTLEQLPPTSPRAPIPNPAHSRTGFSTIMERGVAAAWGWMTNEPEEDQSQQTDKVTAAIPIGPRIAMIALCLAAIVLSLCPWMKVFIYDTRVISSLPSEQLTISSQNPAKLLVVRGNELASGLVSIICFTATMILLLLISSKRRLHVAHGILLTLAAVGAFLAAFFSHEVLESKLYRYRIGDPQQMDAVQARSTVYQRNTPLRELEKTVEPQPWYYGVLGCSGLLVVLSAIGVRHLLTSSSRPQENVKKDSSSGTPFVSRRFSVPEYTDLGPKIVFHFSGLGYELTEELPDCWVFQRGSVMGAMMQTDIRSYPTKLTVRTLSNNELEQLVSCQWSVNLMGAWAGKKDRQLLEDEGKELQKFLSGELGEDDRPDKSPFDEIALEEELNAPSLSMIVFGLIIVLIHLGAVMEIYRVTVQPEFLFPGIFSGTMMLIGGFAMRYTQSSGWSMIGVIGGFLPASPAWIFTAILSTWTLNVLRKPEVKQAFLERKRQRRQAFDSETLSAESQMNLELIQREVSGPSIALMVFGLLCLLGHGLFFGSLLASSHENDRAPLMLPGMLTGFSMFVSGWNFQKLNARGWTQVGIILGMLPLNFTCPISLPLSIWANTVFQRPLVKQAFLDRSLFWKRMSQSRHEQNPGLRKP